MLRTPCHIVTPLDCTMAFKDRDSSLRCVFQESALVTPSPAVGEEMSPILCLAQGTDALLIPKDTSHGGEGDEGRCGKCCEIH